VRGYLATTRTVPDMKVWIVHVYANVPAFLNVN